MSACKLRQMSMWQSKRASWFSSALFGTLTVCVFANAALQSASSRPLTELDFVQTLPLTLSRDGLVRSGNRNSQSQYPTDTNEWRGIRPLTSTRAQVEQILGEPTLSLRRQTFMYENGPDKIDVLYSGSPCEQTPVGRWNGLRTQCSR